MASPVFPKPVRIQEIVVAVSYQNNGHKLLEHKGAMKLLSPDRAALIPAIARDIDKQEAEE
eukprot:12935924-Prorocentrum_lima.AAC.1